MATPSNPKRKNKSPAFWAWTFSITLHIIILLAFALTKFAPAILPAKTTPTQTQKYSAAVKTLTSNPLVLPKPKTKSQNYTCSRFAILQKSTQNTLSPLTPSTVPKPQPPKKPKKFNTEYNFSPKTSTTFFNSETKKRKILYLVDASGSMKGIFNSVRSELIKSINSLQPDQYFCIVFFNAGKITHFPASKKLLRASPSARKNSKNFITTIKPSGPTNALNALKTALEIYHDCNITDGVIYFLTDGFELTKKTGDGFPDEIRKILKGCPKNVNINTIGFWPQQQDKKILQKIADSTNAAAVFVTDDEQKN